MEVKNADGSSSGTPRMDAALAFSKTNPFGELGKSLSVEDMQDVSGVSIPRGAAHLLKTARHLERENAKLRGLLADAQEEMRLIRMKDSPAVYDPTLRARINAALAKATT